MYYLIMHSYTFSHVHYLMFIHLDDRKDPKNWKWTDDSSMSYKDWDDYILWLAKELENG